MNRQERAREYLAVVGLLTKARAQLDALTVGDPSAIPNELKHALDDPIERVRAYGRAILLGDQSPSGEPALRTTNEEADPDSLTCPNTACDWIGSLDAAAHSSGSATFHCPKRGADLYPYRERRS